MNMILISGSVDRNSDGIQDGILGGVEGVSKEPFGTSRSGDETSKRTNNAVETRIVLKCPRQLKHITEVLKPKLKDRLKLGLRDYGYAVAEVKILTPDEVCLERVTPWRFSPPLPMPRLILGLPRPKAFRRMLRQAVILGYKEIHFCHSFRVEKSYWQSPLLDRDVVEEEVTLGLELAEDVHWPKIHFHRRFKPFFEDTVVAWLDSKAGAVCAHPDGDPVEKNEFEIPATLAIGPEGGWVDFELNLMQDLGFKLQSFSPRTMSCETALPYISGRMEASPFLKAKRER